MKDLEIRNIKGIEIRQDDPASVSRTVCGYAIRFNEVSEDIGFYEVIEPGAITQELIDFSDIFAFYNHDTDKVLARSINGQGTLKLTVDEEGVYFEFEAPRTETGDELIEHIKRGELFGTSFGFIVDPDDETAESWEKKDDGTWYRTIHKITYLYEISPVFSPAYSTTSCQTRSTEKINRMETILTGLNQEITLLEDSLKPYNI